MDDDRLSGPSGGAARRARPFWTLVGIRTAFWLATALTLLWAPLRSSLPGFRAYEARSDFLFNTFAQWDSGWFLNIAEHGYRGEQAAAFFPLYPLLTRILAVPLRSTLVAGVVLSLVSAGVAASLLLRIARPFVGERLARDSVLLLALYPLAFVFTAVYSDGLFLALSAGAFLAALRGRSVLAGVLGGLAVATRLIGLALLPALAVLLWRREPWRRELPRLTPLALLPAALGFYALYLQRHFGDAGAFFHAQGVFWLRHTPALGPLSGFWESLSAAWHGALELLRHLPREGRAGEPDQFGSRNVVHFALLLAALGLTWTAWRRLGAAFGLYSLGSLVIVLSSPTTGYPLVSLPRFLLADFPLAIALASLLDGKPRARAWVLAAFVGVGAAAAVGFSRHVWIA